ncbi:hypothetical protein R1sor_023260 [Riccia sorocarpa]|uniref:Reverse transcriptase zinc-binding domain-containing protein n=1 Tax=Riccia sorocarpa TaxID=122646 RepID=A0ABD3GRC8_9MARC
MTIGLSSQGMKQLQRTTREFLWGLAADDDWVRLAEEIIRRTLRNSSKPNDVKRWTPAEVLLGLDSFRTPDSPTLDRMLKAWFKQRTKLKWTHAAGPFPTSTSPKFLMAMLHNILDMPQQGFKLINRDLQRMTDPNDRNITAAINNISDAFPHNDALPIGWEDAAGWTWDTKQTTGPDTWKITTAECKNLQYANSNDIHKLNTKWDIRSGEADWTKRWSQLWADRAIYRTKVRFWRYVRGGYFTNSKARSWGLSERLCPRCNVDIETLEHAFWSCPRLLQRTSWITWLLLDPQETTINRYGAESIQVIFDAALAVHKNSQAALLLLLAALRANWQERNEAQFNGKQHSKGILPIIREAQTEAAALVGKTTRKAKQEIQRMNQLIDYWMMETNRWFQGAQQRNPQPRFNYEDQPQLSTQRRTPPTSPDRRHSQTTADSEDDMIRQDHLHPDHDLLRRLRNGTSPVKVAELAGGLRHLIGSTLSYCGKLVSGKVR